MADLRKFMDGRSRTYDADLLLGDTGMAYATSLPGKFAKNSSTAGITDGYIDLGDGYTQGFAVFDLNTLGAGEPTPAPSLGGNVQVWLEGAKDTSFTSSVPLAMVEWGDEAVSTTGRLKPLDGDDQVDHTRYLTPFHNRYGDHIYRYVRMFVNLGNTLSTLSLSGYLTGLH